MADPRGEEVVATDSSRRPRSRKSDRRSGIADNDQTAEDKILEVAEELIAAHGIYGFRLQDVADRLKVKPPALYNHFQSRDDLIARLAEKLSRDSREGFFRGPTNDQMTAFRHNTRHLARYWYEHPAAARMSLWEIAQSDTKGWEESITIDAEQRERARKAFQRAVDDGEFRDIRFEEYLATILGGVASLVLYPRFDQTSEQASVETLQREADDMIVRLLTPDEPLSRLIQKLWEKESKSSD